MREVAGDRGAGADSHLVLDRHLKDDCVVFDDNFVADADRTMDDVSIFNAGVVADLDAGVIEGMERDASLDAGAAPDHD